MKKIKILFLTFLTLFLISIGFACRETHNPPLCTLTVSDPYGHIVTPLKRKYRGGEEISVTMHDMYSGIRVMLYLNDQPVEDYEALEYPYVRFRFTMPYQNTTLYVSPPYHPDNGGDPDSSSNGISSDSLQSDSTLPEVHSTTFTVMYDYGLHVQNRATMLLSGNMPFFNPSKWNVKTPLLAGDELTVHYTGEMFIQESYPGRVYIVDGGSIQRIEKTKAARLYPLYCQDGELYSADGFPITITHEYVVNADGSCTKVSELPDGTKLYGSSVEEFSCEDMEFVAPQRYNAVYSYNPEAPIKASETLGWVNDLLPSDVVKIESEIYNYSVALNDFVEIKGTTSETEIEKFLAYFKNLTYRELSREEGEVEGGGTAIYTLYTAKGTIEYRTYAGLYYAEDRVFKPFAYPPELTADENGTSYRFKRCSGESRLYINGEYVKDYGTLLQEIVFRKEFSYLESVIDPKYMLEGYDEPVYVLDEKTFWIEEGFQAGVYKLVGERDFSQIFTEYPIGDDLEDKTKRALTVIGATDFLTTKLLPAYAAGERVTVATDILMDACIAMYLNGEYIGSGEDVEIDGKYYWVYSFIMPDCDSVLKIQVEEGFLP